MGALSPWLADGAFPLASHGLASVSAFLVSLPLLIMTPVLLDLSPAFWPYLTLVTTLKAFSPNSYTGVRASIPVNFIGTKLSP